MTDIQILQIHAQIKAAQHGILTLSVTNCNSLILKKVLPEDMNV